MIFTGFPPVKIRKKNPFWNKNVKIFYSLIVMTRENTADVPYIQWFATHNREATNWNNIRKKGISTPDNSPSRGGAGGEVIKH